MVSNAGAHPRLCLASLEQKQANAIWLVQESQPISAVVFIDFHCIQVRRECWPQLSKLAYSAGNVAVMSLLIPSRGLVSNV